jgi:hypothetical protein
LHQKTLAHFKLWVLFALFDHCHISIMARHTADSSPFLGDYRQTRR